MKERLRRPKRGTAPRLDTAQSRRGDLPRQTSDTPRQPRALSRLAGNTAVGQWLARRTGGRPLDPGTRGEMEAAFGIDFGHVRLHDAAQAGGTADALGATALTHGADIHLGSQAPSQASPAGKALLAHELAHVVQQDRAGDQRAGMVSPAADSFEADAQHAAAAAHAGRPAQVAATGAPAAIQRQPRSPAGDDATATATTAGKSAVEAALEGFLNREWDAQSKRERPFRITPAVRQGLEFAFSGSAVGMAVIASDLQLEPGTPEALLARIRAKLPATLPPWALQALHRRATPSAPATSGGEPASPRFGDQPSLAADPLHVGAGARQVPPSTSEADAAAAALQEALRRILDTPAGKELARSVKRFVLSKEGIPVDAVVVGDAVTFVAANDLKVPSLPEIELGEGIKLKIEYSGRIADLPPLVRQMLGERGQVAPGAPETKIGASLTVTDRQMANFLRAVGDFFVMVGRFIARGLVTVGTVISAAARAIWPYVAAAAGGATLGALIGMAFGPLGAGIGALIGAGVGLIGSLLGRLFRRKRGG